MRIFCKGNYLSLTFFSRFFFFYKNNHRIIISIMGKFRENKQVGDNGKKGFENVVKVIV